MSNEQAKSPLGEEENKEKNEVTLNDLDVAYVVGLTEEGNLVFESFGKNKTLISVLGLHHHATNCVNSLYGEHQGKGDTITIEVGKLVQTVNQKLDLLLDKTKKPDNEI